MDLYAGSASFTCCSAMVFAVKPFGPTYTGVATNVFMFAIAFALVCIGAVYFPRKWFYGDIRPGSETYCAGSGYTLLTMHVFIGALQLIGILLLFGFKSGFWVFWQMFYLLSVGLLFHDLPGLSAALCIWSIFGWWRLRYSFHNVLLALVVFVTLALNFALFFGIQAWRQQRGPVADIALCMSFVDA